MQVLPNPIDLNSEESIERFRSLAEALPQIVWTAMPDGNLDYFNLRWYEYTGLTFEQTKKLGWQSVVHPDDLPNAAERWTHSAATGDDYQVEYRFRRAAGGSAAAAYRWHLGRARPLRDKAGAITMWVGVCTDIDDQKRTEAELLKSLKDSNRRVAAGTEELSAVVASLTEQLDDRKSIEEDLRRSEERFQFAARATNDVVWDWNLVTDRLWWNKNFQKLFGYAAEDVGSDINSWIGRVHPDDLERVKQGIYKAIGGGEQSWSDEYRFRRADGSYLLIADRGYVVRDERAGEPLRMVGSMRDVTVQKLVEGRLHENAEHLSAIIKTQYDIAVTENDSRRVMNLITERAQELTGADGAAIEFLEADEMVYRAASGTASKFEGFRLKTSGSLSGLCVRSGEILRCDDTENDSRVDREACRKIGVASMIVVPLVGDGKSVGVLKVSSTRTNAFSDRAVSTLQLMAGLMSAAISHIAEMEARKQAEKFIRRSEEKYRSILETIDEGYFEVDLRANFTFFNDALGEILGYEAVEIERLNFRQYLDKENSTKLEPIFRAVYRSGEPARNVEWAIVRKDKSRKVVESTISLIRDEAGNPNGFRGLVRDITSRKRAEAEAQIISEVMEGISTTSNLNELLGLVHQSINRILDAENCFVALYEEKTELLTMQFFVDKHDFASKPQKVGNGLTAYTFRHARPMLLTSRMIEELVKNGEIELLGTPPAVWLSVPLRTPTRIIGVLVVQHYEDTGAYTERDLELLSAVGDQIAVAIERKRSEEALSESQRAISTLMSNLPGMAYRCLNDKRWTMEFVSAGCFDLTGYAPLELIGYKNVSYAQLINRDDRDFVWNTVQAALQEKKSFEVTYRIVTADGSEKWVWESGQGVFSREDKLIALEGFVADVTERKIMESEIERARDAALESARLKSEFLANTSHEIRTPMNGVIGMSELLLETDLSQNQLEFTQAIQSSADALLKIIDDILDFSKIEAGQLRFEKIDFDLMETVESAVELLADKAQVKEVELASLLYADVPLLLLGDPGRLRQVLMNLIGNAVKFTERGSVVVAVQKQSETDNYALLRFEIKDTGIGIPKEVQKRLFQAFTQADGSTTRKYGGTGLGLAISKQLVEMMGGEIGVESEAGAGSVFWFTVRFEKQKSQKKATVAERETAASLAGARILIVDDNPTNRKVFVHQTESWGMIVEEAESGAQALDCLRRAARAGKAFDVAILDLMMPEMNGFDLAEMIKADPQTAAVRLVLLPSYARRGQTARETGIAAYLQKPIRQSQLYNCLAQVVAERGENEVAQLITSHTLREKKPNAVAAEKAVHPNVRILLAEDNPVNQKVALSQLKILGYAADAAANGRLAIEALEKSKYDIVLMDCQMPEMDGFEATAEIRRREKDRAVKTVVVAMTAHAMEGEREKCLAAGMDDYISKPVKLELLGQVIERWTRGAATVAADDESNRTHHTPPEDFSAIDSLEILDASVLDGYGEYQRTDEPDLVAELIDLFADDSGRRLTLLRQAVAAGDLLAVKHEAHSLRGGSNNIGAHRLAAILEEIELKTDRPERLKILLEKLQVEFGEVIAALNLMH